MVRNLLVAISLITMTVTHMAAAAPARSSCFRDFAETHGYALGYPVAATPTPDGAGAIYLKSGPRDVVQRVFEYDIATGRERELITPEALRNGRGETLSAEEKARRERARVTVGGFTEFHLSRDGASLLLPLDGRLYVLGRADGQVTAIPGEGWIAPKFSPSGRLVAAVRERELRVVDIRTGAERTLTQGASATLQHATAEFAAQEEMGRHDGFWWSPDSRFIAYEEADLSEVEPHYLGDPTHPEKPPVQFRYPRAGTANAKVRLGIVPVEGGGTVWVSWDATAYPYLARVAWGDAGPLTLVVQNRAQTEEKILAVDPRTGQTRELWTERDAIWLDLDPGEGRPTPDMPRWLPDGSGFLWATERNGDWQLELHGPEGALLHPVMPAGLRYAALLDVDPRDGSVTVAAATDRLSRGIYRLPLAGGEATPLAAERGIHDAQFGRQHDVFVHGYNLADGRKGVDLWRRSGERVATLPSAAAEPPALPAVDYLTAGDREFDAQIVRPHDFRAGRTYPVILSVYAGPSSKQVWAAPRLSFERQCLADQGYLVVTIDGRGTPGRGRAWLRAVRGDLITIALEDQVAGLAALAARFPEMDMSRVGVMGWSFGGYFSAMAAMRRPDIFAAGVAGAPVVDWEDYDTHYTERYLGLPAENADGYRRSNVLTYAADLARPLLVVHGLTDDNVYFQHTAKLADALLAAGRPYELVLLPGTHMLNDPALRTRELERVADFFARPRGS